jgi:hypothetical protein
MLCWLTDCNINLSVINLFAVQIIIVNSNSLAQINFPENL